MRVGLLMLADLLWLGFNATVIYQGALLIDSMSTRPMVSGSMLLDLRYVYFAVPAAFTLQSFRILQRWYRDVYKRQGLGNVSCIRHALRQARRFHRVKGP